MKVTQGGQGRFFMYDSLKRLIRARNPEQDVNTNISPALTDPLTANNQWCVKYVYDENSNLLTKTDARNITTTHTYDDLNRVTTRTYDPQNTPAVSYKYDAESLPNGFPAAFTRGFSTGRLVAVTYGGTSAGNYTGYDRLGRVTSSFQQTDSQNHRFLYGYNLASQMTSEKYPSDKEIRTTYDAAGRVNDVKRYINDVLDKTYASQFSYAAQGAVAAMQLGNGKSEHTSFNARLQPTEIGLGANSAATDLLKIEYKYGVLVSNVLDTTKNNGNIQSQIITAPKTQSGTLVLTQTYDYDPLNRLGQATETGGTNEWSQTYSYDRFGNRAVTGTIFDTALTPQSLAAYDSATNRINPAVMTGFGYDTAGNLTRDPNTPPTNGILYDAENHQTGFTKTGPGGGTTNYSYDGDGHRVKKTDPSNNTTIFVYNAGGQLIAEYTSGAPSGGGTSYLTSDHLGSTRVVTKQDGSVKARYDYLPFGEEIGSDRGSRTLVTGYGASEGTRQKFTQKERDSESGLDYFGARYYSSAQGRFTSPDEFAGGPDELYDFAESASDNPTLYAELIDPQSLNKYQYCYDNPLNLIDPDGHQSTFSKYHAKVSECSANAAIGVGKSVANVGIGINNLMAAYGFGKYVAPYEEKGDCQYVAMHATDVAIILSPLAGKGAPVGMLMAEAEETAVVVAETANAKAAAAELKPGSPALKGDPYSPGEVSKRQSQTRRDLGTGNIDPNSPIPEQSPGRNIKGQHKADTTQQHRTGERNVNPSEEHSRKAKGTGDKPRNQ